jgi:lipoate-protein ligase A
MSGSTGHSRGPTITSLVEHVGTVAELHALDPFAAGPVAVPEVWWCRPVDDAVVLGSRQTAGLLDAAACARAGLATVRRRSGGGIVLIRHEALTWIDLVLPHGIAPDDVRGAMVWAGERWRAALVDVAGLDPARLEVHHGGMVTSPWSELVCFAGLGPGEVLADRRKLVGLSQRRTRHGLRIQGLVHRAPVDDVVGVLAVPPPPGAPPEVAVCAVDAAQLAAALVARLDHR